MAYACIYAQRVSRAVVTVFKHYDVTLALRHWRVAAILMRIITE